MRRYAISGAWRSNLTCHESGPQAHGHRAKILLHGSPRFVYRRTVVPTVLWKPTRYTVLRAPGSGLGAGLQLMRANFGSSCRDPPAASCPLPAHMEGVSARKGGSARRGGRRSMLRSLRITCASDVSARRSGCACCQSRPQACRRRLPCAPSVRSGRRSCSRGRRRC
jgi:hypothetical protein